ncbi:hypothetical protein B0G83_11975 [Paraburkholderia sp. BL21I4N1]|nr:hypothetical protein B0G83_11975 [Paraburkholderia sp. BL21I4N1]
MGYTWLNTSPRRFIPASNRNRQKPHKTEHCREQPWARAAPPEDDCCVTTVECAGGTPINHRDNKARPTPRSTTSGKTHLLNPKNPPGKPLGISVRNRIRWHHRPGIPLPRAPLKHAFLKLRNRIGISAIAFGDRPKGRPDFSGIDGMTSPAGLFAGRGRVCGIRGIPGGGRNPSSKSSRRSTARNYTHNNPHNPHSFHNPTPEKGKEKAPPNETAGGAKAKRSIQQRGTTKSQTDHRGGQGLAGAPITGLPNNGVDNAYAPFSVKAQMMLRSYSV